MIHPEAGEKVSTRSEGSFTHPVAEDIGSVIFAVLAGPDGAVIAAIGGDLDIASAPAVRERLLSLLRPGACRLVIDMSAVRYADASGLAVLVSTQRRAILLGGGLRLAAPRPEAAATLAVTGLSRHLAAYPTVRAAVAGRKPCPAATAASAPPAQSQAGPGAGSGELHAAVAALLASADAWRGADPHRRFSPALRALAQADAGNSQPSSSAVSRRATPGHGSPDS